MGLCIWVQCLQRPEKATRSSGTGFISGCEMPDVGLQSELGSSGKAVSAPYHRSHPTPFLLENSQLACFPTPGCLGESPLGKTPMTLRQAGKNKERLQSYNQHRSMMGFWALYGIHAQSNMASPSLYISFGAYHPVCGLLLAEPSLCSIWQNFVFHGDEMRVSR